jgi:sorting nexin-1/2
MVRRYSDFEWLRTKLADRFRGVVVPPLPEKAVISTSRCKYDVEPKAIVRLTRGVVAMLLATDRFNKEFVTYRRKELERFLKRIVQHKLFIDAEEFKAFFQPSEDVRPP